MSTQIYSGWSGNGRLEVTSFFGGRDRGGMLQFDTVSRANYAQLDEEEVKRLVIVLNHWLHRFDKSEVEYMTEWPFRRTKVKP